MDDKIGERPQQTSPHPGDSEPRNPPKPSPRSQSGIAEAPKAPQKERFFQRLGASFQEMIQSSRGTPGRSRGEPVVEAPENAVGSADDLALRRAKSVSPKRMIVPEGVIIGGSITSSCETEISGRVEGDVAVDGRLYLGPAAVISGSVRAVACKVEGLVEGKMQCSQEMELGPTGRVNADAVAAKKVTIAGQIVGNVSTGGVLRLVATGRIQGNILAKQLVIEEGATFNGSCGMRRPPVGAGGTKE